MPKTMLSRRLVLRGAVRGVGVGVGLPALCAMLNNHGTALADGRVLPRRLGVFFWGNGVRLNRWTPAATGVGWSITDELRPLQDLKPYLSVVSGTRILTGNERGHHAGCVGALSGAPMMSQPHPTSGYASTFRAPTIDQIAADRLGKTTPFRSLELGVSQRATDNEGTTLQYLSHRGPDNPNPPEYDPARAFDRLFGSTAGGPLPADRAIGKSVLDAVAADARALQTRVGKADHARVEQHLENIRDIERRLVTTWLRPARCPLHVSGRGAVPASQGNKEPLAEINEAHSRIVALALSCDLTRVFSLMFSGSVSGTVFWQVGADKGHHQLTHDEAGEQPLVHAATVFTMKQFAVLLQTLRGTPEGAGNLLDSVAVLATSDLAQGREHSLDDYPFLVAGRAGGRLRGGVHVRDVGGNASTILLTVLRAVGVPLAAFGSKGGHVTEGCRGLEV